MAVLKIVRYEPYPATKDVIVGNGEENEVIHESQPAYGYAVGFAVTTPNGHTFYIDTVVEFDEATDTQAVIDAAIAKLREQIDAKIAELDAQPPIIGTIIELE